MAARTTASTQRASPGGSATISPRDLQFDQRLYYTASRNEFDGYDTPTGVFGDDAEFGRTQQVVDYTGLNLSLFDGR